MVFVDLQLYLLMAILLSKGQSNWPLFNYFKNKPFHILINHALKIKMNFISNSALRYLTNEEVW